MNTVWLPDSAWASSLLSRLCCGRLSHAIYLVWPRLSRSTRLANQKAVRGGPQGLPLFDLSVSAIGGPQRSLS
jgi:hypothetical protein